MSALTMSARLGNDTDLRPVPWRRMAWVTWRQHRFALAGVAGLLGALAAYLVFTGLPMHHAYAAVAACRPASSLACSNAIGDFDTVYWATAEAIAVFLQVVPALIGAFAAAPILARELETGTFRYAWTQGIGRTRWTLAKLVPLAVTAAAAAGAFSVLFYWYFKPFVDQGLDTRLPPLAPLVFDLHGVAFAAWTLAACSIGALAGMLIRRVVPAIAATMAAWARPGSGRRAVPAPALPDPLGRPQPQPAWFRLDHQLVVHRAGRKAAQPGGGQPVPPGLPPGRPPGRTQLDSDEPRPGGLHHPARLHSSG